ncbi:MAG: zinc ABC transporter substrate-binding protein [Acidobacteriota bacterium]|nr:zinc ABC transporter substrate-binding protein [Acidobacteriota bacterium]
MLKNTKKVILVGIIGLFLFILYPVGLLASDKVVIITTVFPLKEFAEGVCGKRAEVHLLISPGVEVHTWKPKPSDIVRLSSCDLIIYIGANLEPWIYDILHSIKNPNLKVIEASHGLSLLKEEATNSHKKNRNVDPHIWLDFVYDQMIVDKIATVLAEIDPQGASFYAKNAISYNKKLQRLDNLYKEKLKDCIHRTFILGGHSAFGYLAKRYGLKQVSLYGLNPDAKPTPKQLIKVVELAKKHEINVIYFEEYVSDDLAQIISKEINARTLVLNPGANLKQREIDKGISFFDIMEKNLENLRIGLICE